MPIIKQAIKAEILALLNSTADLKLEDAKDQFSDKLAGAIENALKSAIVVIAPGAIITAGSAVTQTNAAPVQGTLQ